MKFDASLYGPVFPPGHSDRTSIFYNKGGGETIIQFFVVMCVCVCYDYLVASFQLVNPLTRNAGATVA